MSTGWMDSLVETYDRCIKDPDTRTEDVPLVPICHTINNAQITVTIRDGRFVSAEAIPKDDQMTIIPCTEDSAARTSGPSPHPLDDKLIYLAGNLSKYRKISKSFAESHALYMDQLKRWTEYDPTNKKLSSLYSYLASDSLMDDLISSGILILGDDGMLADKASAPDAKMFSVAKIADQGDAFVRWAIDAGEPCIDTWTDESLVESWISFMGSQEGEVGLCYITGEIVPLAQKHPSKIRNSGDGAKIISGNDTSGFTFRGRFETPDQACGIGFQASQKMHAALRWLIGRQGYSRGEFTIVAWTVTGEKVSSPSDDLAAELGFEDDNVSSWTNAVAAQHLNNRIRGYNSEIIGKEVTILCLDSATSGKGRIAVTYFRRELGDELIGQLEKWHKSCAWIHRYAKAKGSDGEEKRIVFIGAPAPKDIAMAAYGSRADDRIIATVVKRILPCILDGERIPRDIEESVVRRACNPVSMETWEWAKTLSIACSVFKQCSGGRYEMVLEKERTSRDYLYGRLLAIADLMEGSALRSAGESRQTTAIRLMQRFSEFPYTTWKDIELSLVPYAARLGPKAGYYEKKIAEVMDLFEGDDFRDNSKLSGEFLLAYHCQREDQFKKKEDNVETEEE